MKKSAKALRRLCPKIDVLASSPFTRAIETAEIVAEAYEHLKIIQRPELSPTKRRDLLLRWLQSQKAKATIAIVGHEPHLGAAASWLMTGLGDSVVQMKKGSACLLSFDSEIAAGRAQLQWLLTPHNSAASAKRLCSHSHFALSSPPRPGEHACTPMYFRP